MPLWQPIAAAPPLRTDELHLWRIDLHADAQWRPLLALLAADERSRAERFHLEIHRRRYAVGRAALRTLLGAYLKRPPQTLAIAYNAHGKPRLADGGAGIKFNLSHSHEIMLAAFAMNREVGVDIEFAAREVDCMEIGKRWFSAREAGALAALPERERRAAFFRVWSRKEAYLKARGEGLSHPLHRFSVSPDKTEPRLVEHQDDALETARWNFFDVAAAADYTAAAVIEAAEWRIRQYHFAQRLFRPE